MIYTSADEWLGCQNKRALLFAMSGLGKTHLSSMLRAKGDWFHYSIDYRIGTRYMGEYIVDNFKRVAMQDPFLADLLRSDSIYIGANMSFENLLPLSTYLGKPGDPDLQGIPIEEYQKRQKQHHRAEIQALLDTPMFIERAESIYGYNNFICDTGGSICEVVDPKNPHDPVMKTLHDHVLMIWIQGSDTHTAELIRRFDKAPKPMCYDAEFLTSAWADYLEDQSIAPDKVNPDDFIRWTYARAMTRRQPKYAAMSEWGLTISAEDAQNIETPQAFEALIAKALDEHVTGSK